MGTILLYKVSAPVQAAAAKAEATDQNKTRPYLFGLGAMYIFKQEGIKCLKMLDKTPQSVIYCVQ